MHHNFYILPSSLNFDIQTEIEVKLRNFGFQSNVDMNNRIFDNDITIEHINTSDIIISIMPGDDFVYKYTNHSIHEHKNVFIIGAEAGNSNFLNNYNSFSKYKNVFIINEFEKSYGIIHKHMSELKNVYEHIKLEQCDYQM